MPRKHGRDQAREREQERVFSALMGEVVRAELREESDDERALRKALLAMLAIHAECCGGLLERFHTFLLTEFAPLAAHFQDHRQELVGRQDVMRGLTNDGRVRLLLPESLAHLIASYEPTD